MILLEKQHYDRVWEPLQQVSVNTLFARFVVSRQVTGTIYVDQPDLPKTFYIIHPYGMSLLFGHADNSHFNLQLLDYLLNTAKTRSKPEWLQAYPGIWNQRLADLLGDQLVKFSDNPDGSLAGKVEENTRVNFRFNRDKYHDFRQSLRNEGYHIVRTNRKSFDRMQGTVVPKYFWDNADDFCRQGVGFTMLMGDIPVSTAYSAYITENQLELGIETLPEYRGKGYALHTCSALIDYCMENNFEPVWSCRYENTGSYKLAQELGFEPTVTLPYYRLPV
jgi:GNAT superfamily N-acetyltransferase